MSAYKVKSDYTFTIEKGSAWGTAVDTSPIGLPCEDMVFSIEPNNHRLNRAWGYRGQHADNTWQDTFGKIPTASVSVIMTPQLMEVMLPGMLQKSGDWSDNLGLFSMHTNNYADLPSPKTNNDGYYYTLVRNSPKANDDEVLASALASSLKLSISPNDNEGILKADFEFIGKGYSKGETQSGSVSHAALDDMYKWGNIANVSFGSADLTSDFVSAEINVTNGAKLVSDIPDGEIVFPKWEVTGTLKVIANQFTEAMKDKCLSREVNMAEELSVAFGNVVPAAEGDLIIKSNAYLTGWSSDYEEGEVIEFTFEGVFGDSAYPLEVEFFHETI